MVILRPKRSTITTNKNPPKMPIKHADNDIINITKSNALTNINTALPIQHRPPNDDVNLLTRAVNVNSTNSNKLLKRLSPIEMPKQITINNLHNNNSSSSICINNVLAAWAEVTIRTISEIQSQQLWVMASLAAAAHIETPIVTLIIITNRTRVGSAIGNRLSVRSTTVTRTVSVLPINQHNGMQSANHVTINTNNRHTIAAIRTIKKCKILAI